MAKKNKKKKPEISRGKAIKPPAQRSVEEQLPELSPMQLKFITHYLATGNASQSALDAGYANRTSGARLLSNDVISGIVAAHRKEMEHKFNISREALLQELSAIAFFNLKSVMQENSSGVSLKAWNDIPDHIAKAIQSVNESDGGNGGFSQSVRGPAKQPAIESLWKKMGYKNAEIGSESDTPEAIDAALAERVSGVLSKRKKS